jgi:hypothetical protein
MMAAGAVLASAVGLDAGRIQRRCARWRDLLQFLQLHARVSQRQKSKVDVRFRTIEFRCGQNATLRSALRTESLILKTIT